MDRNKLCITVAEAAELASVPQDVIRQWAADKNRRVKMKKLAGIMLVTCFGILEGSDVQGYELHSSTMLLLLLCTVSAVAILYKSFKEDEHYGRY